MKILVLGHSGQLGQCLYDQLKNTDYEVIFSSRSQINITNFEETKNSILKIMPSVIINAAAYTAVDKAEDENFLSNLINHLAVSNIADVCQKIGCWLIHISTDYVFDGNSKIPYIEGDKPNPQGVYGKTKYKGEIAVRLSGCKHIILRTAWVFSEHGNNFFKTMLKLGKERDELNIVYDQIGCPTYAQDIAEAIKNIIPQLDKNEDKQGIFHFCGDISCSWYTFAEKIFEACDELGYKTPNSLNPIKTSQFPTPAIRPKYSILNCEKICSTWGIKPSNWKSAIKIIMKKTELKHD
jgi:dTDP-4-dehydrorhamnose reductase